MCNRPASISGLPEAPRGLIRAAYHSKRPVFREPLRSCTVTCRPSITSRSVTETPGTMFKTSYSRIDAPRTVSRYSRSAFVSAAFQDSRNLSMIRVPSLNFRSKANHMSKTLVLCIFRSWSRVERAGPELGKGPMALCAEFTINAVLEFHERCRSILRREAD
jgi:hypothetical protein